MVYRLKVLLKQGWMSTQLLKRLNYIRYSRDFGFEFQSRSPSPCQTDERIVNFIRFVQYF